MSAELTFPVQVLREHTTALEAAISVCMADPDHKPVHKLRTETRRVEAELVLLAQLAEVPEHRGETNGLLKQLKKLRRAAGKVRDLDVQRKLLDEFADPEAVNGSSGDGAGAQTKAAHGTAKKAARGKAKQANGAKRNGANADGSGPAADGGSDAAQSALQKGASDLRAHMGKQRDALAADLLKLLKKRQTKAASAAEKLLKTLEPAEELALEADHLLHHAHGLLERDGLLARGDAGELSKNDLHTIRKAAKRARYLAETLPENAAAAEAARHFESLQETGGQWHDLLELAREARRYLGKGHELTVRLAEERDRRLELYRSALAGEMKAGAAGKKPSRAAGTPTRNAGRRGVRKAAAA